MAASTDKLRRAIVVGSSGATGREVVKELINRKWEVTTISRSKMEFPLSETTHQEAKLIQIVSNFSSLDDYVSQCNGFDAMFNCLGTTRGQAGSADAFVAVEVGLTKKACDFAKKAGVRHVGVVSAQGANKDVWVPTTLIHPFLYTRTLGEKQQTVLDAGFASTTVFQPGLLNRLMGDRLWENVAVALVPGISLGVDILAKAMVKDAETKLNSLDNSANMPKIESESVASDQQTCTGGSSSLVSFFTGNYNIAEAAK